MRTLFLILFFAFSSIASDRIEITPNFKHSHEIVRDSHGHIKRSHAAKIYFMNLTGYPNGRKGYVIDHIISLKRGGFDCPCNMQWQTIADAKAKDKTE